MLGSVYLDDPGDCDDWLSSGSLDLEEVGHACCELFSITPNIGPSSDGSGGNDYAYCSHSRVELLVGPLLESAAGSKSGLCLRSVSHVQFLHGR